MDPKALGSLGYFFRFGMIHSSLVCDVAQKSIKNTPVQVLEDCGIIFLFMDDYTVLAGLYMNLCKAVPGLITPGRFFILFDKFFGLTYNILDRTAGR